MQSRPETKDECYKDGQPTTAAEATVEPAPVVVKAMEVPEDVEQKVIGNKVAMEIHQEAANAIAAIDELQPEPLYSTKVDINHVEGTKDKYKNMDKVLTNLLLNYDDLDPTIFFRKELQNRDKSPHLSILSKVEQDELFNKLLTDKRKSESVESVGKVKTEALTSFRYNTLSSETTTNFRKMKTKKAKEEDSKRRIQH